jgi:hypothetical protein
MLPTYAVGHTRLSSHLPVWSAAGAIVVEQSTSARARRATTRRRRSSDRARAVGPNPEQRGSMARHSTGLPPRRSSSASSPRAPSATPNFVTPRLLFPQIRAAPRRLPPSRPPPSVDEEDTTTSASATSLNDPMSAPQRGRGQGRPSVLAGGGVGDRGAARGGTRGQRTRPHCRA